MAHGIGAIKAGGLAPFAERFLREMESSSRLPAEPPHWAVVEPRPCVEPLTAEPLRERGEPPALMAPMPWAITTAGCGPGLSGRYSQASSSSPEAVGIRTVVRRGMVETKAASAVT